MNEKPIASELEISAEHLAEADPSLRYVRSGPDLLPAILALVDSYVSHKVSAKKFTPGETYIPCTGKMVGVQEALNMVEAAVALDLTSTGKWNPIFEKRLGEYLSTDYVTTCNSGSSANLLAVAALMSPSLGYRALIPGDEVICSAVGFPTTVNPLLQCGLVPVFVDAKLPYYTIDPEKVADAIGPHTKALMLDHTLGNPCDMARIMKIAQEHFLWVINDTCDAMTSKYDGVPVGVLGDLATLSFFPAHTITTGEGGAVYTDNSVLHKIVASISNWGKRCVCPPNHDNVCGKRFGWQVGGMPLGYDDKYLFSELGFNLKMTDMQAACGVAQMERIKWFAETRKTNYTYLRKGLEDLQDVLLLPESLPNSDTSWFCMPLTLLKGERLPLMQYLESKRIGTRLIFAGNLTKQPYLYGKNTYRVSGALDTADRVMSQSFSIGLHPSVTFEMMTWMIKVLHDYFKEL
jgi:CDP-6-deoxy-D-xylo-4-hexulose-3-dehydrase